MIIILKNEELLVYKLLFLCFIVLRKSINTYQKNCILPLASLTLSQRREEAREQEKEGWGREEEEKEKEKERENIGRRTKSLSPEVNLKIEKILG